MIKSSIKYILLAIVILFLSFFIFISTTTPGARFIFNVVSHFTPGTLKFASVSGAINRTITIKSISYHNNSVAISGDMVQLHLQPLALLLNELRIDSLQAKHLKIHLLTTQASNKPISAPHFFLPVTLKLTYIHIQTIDFIKSKQAYQLQNFALNSFIKSNTIDINHLQTTYQKNDYIIQGTIKLNPIDFNLQLQSMTPQTKLFATQISGHGDWKKLQITTNINVPSKIEATLTLHNIFTQLTWQLAGKLQYFSAQHYIKTIAYQHITGTFKGSGTAKQENFAAHILPDATTPNSNINFQLSSENLQHQQLTAQLTWQNLSLPSLKIPYFSSIQGKLRLNGTLNKYHIASNINFSGQKIPTGTLHLDGNGNLQHLIFNKILIKTLNGNISGNTKLSWKPQLSYQGQFTAQHLQPQQKWVDWPGTINFTSKIIGTANNNKIAVTNLHGTLREQKLTGQASVQWLNKHVEQALLELSLGKAKAELNLQHHSYLKATWDVNIPDLAKATPFVNGEIDTQGNLTTTDSLPIISGYINGKNLAWLNYQAGTLNSKFKLDLNSSNSSNVQLTASQVKLFNYNFNSVNFSGVGNQKQQQQLNLAVTANNERLNVKALSHHQNQQWQVTASQFSLLSAQHIAWQLKHPFTLIYAPHLLALKDFAWQANQQTLDANFSIKNNVLQKVSLVLHQVALDLFNLFMPNNIHLQGNLNIQASYNNSEKNNDMGGNIQANAQNIKIQYLLQGKKQVFAINNGVLQANLNQQKLNAALKLKLSQNDYLNATLTADPFKWNNNFLHTQSTQGTVSAHFSKLDFLNLFFPQLESIKGTANLNLNWHGTAITPHLTGSASIEKAAATIPAQGLQLKNIQLQATAKDNRVDYQLQATSGNGTLTANGSSYLDPTYSTKLALQGSKITVINTPQYQITASPNLKLAVNKNHINLTGDITLPKVHINQTNYANVVSLTNEVVITNSQQNTQTFPLWNKLHTRIKFILGNDIEFKNDHLNAKLAGSLVLIDNPRAATRANGELTITTGTFTIFGQTLNIEDGKLIYVGGPTTNPGLDIKATKTMHTFISPTQNSLTQTSLSPARATPSQQINIPLQQKTIVVGVSVTNTLNNPHITLFSDEPGLSQTDILSYLVLGYPDDNASNQQAQALLRAVDALNANNNNTAGIIDRFKKTLNLDQVGLQSDAFLNSKTNTVQQNTSLVLGKMLSPKLFVRYSIGLIEPINTLSTAYQFNQHWTAQTQSNSLGNGIDLTYSWEQK